MVWTEGSFRSPIRYYRTNFLANPIHIKVRKVKVLVAQSCLTFCNPMDCSSSGSSVHGFLQARILEWIPIPFSRGSSQPGTEARSPISPALQVDSLPSEPPGKPINCPSFRKMFSAFNRNSQALSFHCLPWLFFKMIPVSWME